MGRPRRWHFGAPEVMRPIVTEQRRRVIAQHCHAVCKLRIRQQAAIRDESGSVARTIAVQLIPAGADRRQDAPNPGNCPF